LALYLDKDPVMTNARFGHILILEASAGRGQLIQEVLEELGYKTASAGTSQQARTALERGVVDLLIANIGSDDAGRPALQQAATLGIPYVLISRTGKSQTARNRRAVTTVIDAPYTLEHLSDAVAQILSTNRGHDSPPYDS
jgi:DNA-binding NtrC family response regulator